VSSTKYILKKYLLTDDLMVIMKIIRDTSHSVLIFHIVYLFGTGLCLLGQVFILSNFAAYLCYGNRKSRRISGLVLGNQVSRE
jgi:hypothetical protein